ncbi:DUF262 domain-containing protein [Peribacillus castrilensis]|uniref:GmrSD restriction endonuclease domain-containing protein n=1 Tax=Peribacillus TaxID=2675229 RepID=UPI0038713F3B
MIGKLTTKLFDIGTLYEFFKKNKLVVNRNYQRNLVWDKIGKQNLIDTVHQKYPIPSLIFGSDFDGEQFEVIDGVQRLDALFGYIENKFSVVINGSAVFFNKNDISSTSVENVRNLTSSEVDEFLSSCIPVIIYNGKDPKEINDIFLRINSFGKALTAQEIRQAGEKTDFLILVKKMGRLLREDILTDVDKAENKLKFLDEIKRNVLGFELKIEDTFWCKHGIFTPMNLKRSSDEELIADIVLSIVLGKPFPVGRDQLDEFYGIGKLNKSSEIDRALQNYGIDQIVNEMVTVFKNIVFMCKVELEDKSNTLSKVFNGSEKPKDSAESFYTLFIAMHELIFKKATEPINYSEIFLSLNNLSKKLSYDGTSTSREINVNQCVGLIQNYFKRTDDTEIILNNAEFEHLIKMSRVESPNYDFKQGLFTLNPSKRELEKGMFETIFCTIAALANLGKGRKGYLFIGITDKERDTLKIELLDQIKVPRIYEFGIVGLEREAQLKGVSIDDYISMVTHKIRQSKLPEWLKTQVNTSVKPKSYKDFTVLIINVYSGEMPVWYNSKLYTRNGSGNYSSQEESYVDSVFKLFM